MAKERKPEQQQRRKPNETKYYHKDDEAAYVDKRVRVGGFKNRQHYIRELIRQDRQKQSG